MFRYPFLAVLLVGTASPVAAVNPAFFPGDAFFHSRIDADWADDADGESFTLGYSLPDSHEFAMCGYAGYWTLEVGNGDELKRYVAEVYHLVRKGQPRQLIQYEDDPPRETNPLHVFVYAKDFELSFGVGLKFNENWADRISLRNAKPGLMMNSTAGRYVSFVDTAKGVARDWRYAATVAPLPVKPRETELLWGDREGEVLRIEADNVQILVVPFDDLSLIAGPSKRSPAFYRVTTDGIDTLRMFNGDIRVTTPGETDADWILENIEAAKETLEFLREMHQGELHGEDEGTPE